jgi:hypothetical protein
MAKQSILVKDMETCMVCGSPYVHKHHLFGASDRDWSEKFGLFVPLCFKHHNGSDEGVHYNKKFMDALHQYGRERFKEVYPELNFLDYFRKNYYEEDKT